MGAWHGCGDAIWQALFLAQPGGLSPISAVRSLAQQPCLRPMTSSSWESPGHVLFRRCWRQPSSYAGAWLCARCDREESGKTRCTRHGACPTHETLRLPHLVLMYVNTLTYSESVLYKLGFFAVGPEGRKRIAPGKRRTCEKIGDCHNRPRIRDR